MAMKIRLARGGSKKRPHYSIVAADSRMARDGRFIEKLGTYDPLQPKDSERRVVMQLERVQHWIERGAKPTDRVARFLEAAGLRDATERQNLRKGEPGAKAKERAEERAARAPEPSDDAPAEAATAEAATAEAAPIEAAPVEDAPAEAATAEAATAEGAAE